MFLARVSDLQHQGQMPSASPMSERVHLCLAVAATSLGQLRDSTLVLPHLGERILLRNRSKLGRRVDLLLPEGQTPFQGADRREHATHKTAGVYRLGKSIAMSLPRRQKEVEDNRKKVL